LRKRIADQRGQLNERDRSQFAAWQQEELRAAESDRIAEEEIRRTRKLIDSLDFDEE